MASLADLLRTVVTYVGGVLITVVCAIAAIIVSAVSPGSDAIEKVIHLWSTTWLRISGTRLRVVGAEVVDTSRSYVVVANHESAFDIMACFLAVPVPIRFLAKKELFRIPLLAQAMKAIGIVEVDRQARVAIHEQLNEQAKALIAAGRSVIIYPEGTRTRTGALGPFKKGAFTIALGLGLPILPVAIEGSYEAWRPGSFLIKGGEITVTIEAPIETDGLERADANDLRDRAREVIARVLESQS
ncbi:MAG TPA: lysophospholipid acyltransferase family protein [Acidimicrobiia bacterium]|nr:lysophospholipid acyltransferase family protein [Acidimicrobiia bacterium]